MIYRFGPIDQYDVMVDEIKNQPDGLIDHFMIIHAGGQEQAWLN